jgi:hypothetical protein
MELYLPNKYLITYFEKFMNPILELIDDKNEKIKNFAIFYFERISNFIPKYLSNSDYSLDTPIQKILKVIKETDNDITKQIGISTLSYLSKEIKYDFDNYFIETIDFVLSFLKSDASIEIKEKTISILHHLFLNVDKKLIEKKLKKLMGILSEYHDEEYEDIHSSLVVCYGNLSQLKEYFEKYVDSTFKFILNQIDEDDFTMENEDQIEELLEYDPTVCIVNDSLRSLIMYYDNIGILMDKYTSDILSKTQNMSSFFRSRFENAINLFNRMFMILVNNNLESLYLFKLNSGIILREFEHEDYSLFLSEDFTLLANLIEYSPKNYISSNNLELKKFSKIIKNFIKQELLKMNLIKDDEEDKVDEMDVEEETNQEETNQDSIFEDLYTSLLSADNIVSVLLKKEEKYLDLYLKGIFPILLQMLETTSNNIEYNSSILLFICTYVENVHKIKKETFTKIFDFLNKKIFMSVIKEMKDSKFSQAYLFCIGLLAQYSGDLFEQHSEQYQKIILLHVAMDCEEFDNVRDNAVSTLFKLIKYQNLKEEDKKELSILFLETVQFIGSDEDESKIIYKNFIKELKGSDSIYMKEENYLKIIDIYYKVMAFNIEKIHNEDFERFTKIIKKMLNENDNLIQSLKPKQKKIFIKNKLIKD